MFCFPPLNLPLKLQLLLGPILPNEASFGNLQLNILQLRLLLVEFLVLLIDFILQVGVLFEYEFILEFIILCPSESDPCSVEILLEGVAVVF